MDFLFTRGGYVLVDRHDNALWPGATEIVLVRLGQCAGLGVQRDVFKGDGE